MSCHYEPEFSALLFRTALFSVNVVVVCGTVAYHGVATFSGKRGKVEKVKDGLRGKVGGGGSNSCDLSC